MTATYFKFAMISMVVLLTGCSSGQMKHAYPPIAIPFQPTLQQQVQLARIDQLLERQDIPKETLAKVFYERGLVLDSLGLRDLARLNFNQSLSLVPDQPEIYNILGIYFIQTGSFDEAYDAFDSCLELAPDHPFAERNRGIALYYGERYDLANQDLLPHYKADKNDPYLVIWLYLNDLQLTPKQAHKLLQQRFDASDKQNWGWNIVKFYLGDITEDQLLKDIQNNSENENQLAERLTEAYFYMAKQYQEKQDYSTAKILYKLSLSGNVYEFIEHRFSLLELSRLFESHKDLIQGYNQPPTASDDK